MCVHWYFTKHFSEVSYHFFPKLQRSYFGRIGRFLELRGKKASQCPNQPRIQTKYSQVVTTKNKSSLC